MVEIIRRVKTGSTAPAIDAEGVDPNDPILKKNPALKSYMQKFIDSVRILNPARKIDMLYKAIIKKDPLPELNLDKKLNRMLYEQELKEKDRETDDFLNLKKKKFKFGFKARREMKKSLKKLNLILVLFLTKTGEIIGPTLYPIYSGNMVIINHCPYELDPRAVWRFGKFRALVIKEIDRRPVSNLDWDEIKKRGDATHSDEFLIKAAMRAYQGTPAQKKPFNIWILVIIGVVVIGALIFFFMKGS
ncbi:hypothetical protein M0R04_08905 [Candidatus Dojkabacteria bacterium]|jgi:hypothetical protein|nr:hypothetical protein [Candidatus Dojkabacteria bacterium]